MALKETRGHAARAAVHRSQSLMERGQLHEAMLWLARALELAPDEDGEVRHFARASFASLEADAPVLKAMWVPGHAGPVAVAAFSADGTTVLTGSEAADGSPGEARLWDAMTGEPRTGPLSHEGSVTLAAISPDGEALLTACSPQPGQSELRVWEAATGRPLTDPVPYPGTPTALVCGPKGKTFFTLGTPKPDDPAEARFWEVAGGTATSLRAGPRRAGHCPRRQPERRRRSSPPGATPRPPMAACASGRRSRGSRRFPGPSTALSRRPPLPPTARCGWALTRGACGSGIPPLRD